VDRWMSVRRPKFSSFLPTRILKYNTSTNSEKEVTDGWLVTEVVLVFESSSCVSVSAPALLTQLVQ
jgi:hypothetical protein